MFLYLVKSYQKIWGPFSLSEIEREAPLFFQDPQSSYFRFSRNDSFGLLFFKKNDFDGSRKSKEVTSKDLLDLTKDLSWENLNFYPEIFEFFLSFNADPSSFEKKNQDFLEEKFILKSKDIVIDKKEHEIQDDISEVPRIFLESNNSKIESKTDLNKISKKIDKGESAENKTLVRRVHRPYENFEKTIIKKDQNKNQFVHPRSELDSLHQTKNVFDKEQVQDLVEELDKTSVLNLDELKQLKKEIHHFQENESVLNSSETIQGVENSTGSKAVESSKRKGITWISALAIMTIAYFALFDEDTDKEIVPISPQVTMPVIYSQENIERSQQEFNEGLALYLKGDFLSKKAAAEHFSNSVSFKLDGNQALAYLVLSYAELLPHVFFLKKNQNNQSYVLDHNGVVDKAGSIIFELLKIAEVQVSRSPYYHMGKGLIYSFFGRHAAAIAIFERFLYQHSALKESFEKSLKDNKVDKIQNEDAPNLKFFYSFFKILIQAENLQKARKWYEKLASVKNKPPDLFVLLSQYFCLQYDYDKSLEILKEGIKEYPQNLELIIEYGNVLIVKEDFKGLIKVAKKIRDVLAESSSLYYAKYLEFLGVIYAQKGQTQLAAENFSRSLNIRESGDVRSKLALLNVNEKGKDLASQLILESKVLRLIKDAQDFVKNRNWEQAFSSAINAVDLMPKYIKSHLLLADIQIQKGFLGDAVETLKKIKEIHPSSYVISYALVDAYVASYKFDEAKKILDVVSVQEDDRTSDYFKLWGKYYFYQNKFTDSLRSFQDADIKNPIDDEVKFFISQIFFKMRNYVKAQEYLISAIELDPARVEYRIQHSRILYEKDSADVAIGNLMKILLDNESVKELDDEGLASIISEVAIYYYRNGQMNQFEFYKKKLEGMDSPGIGLYSFLIQMGKLEDQPKMVVENYKKILSLLPGNLKMRMEFGEYYLERGEVKESLDEFWQVYERLKNYPKLLFYIGKVHYLQGNTSKAIEYAKMEIENNPNLEAAYLLLGEIYFKNKDYIQANEVYKKVQGLNPNSPEGITGLANVKFAENNFEASLELYLKAAELDPNNGVIRRQLGYVYKSLGQSGLAVESFKVYLKIFPDAQDRRIIETLVNELK